MLVSIIDPHVDITTPSTLSDVIPNFTVNGTVIAVNPRYMIVRLDHNDSLVRFYCLDGDLDFVKGDVVYIQRRDGTSFVVSIASSDLGVKLD